MDERIEEVIRRALAFKQERATLLAKRAGLEAEILDINRAIHALRKSTVDIMNDFNTLTGLEITL